MASEPGDPGHHRGHDHDHHHEHGARISTPEERALLAPFVDDVCAFLLQALAGVQGSIAEIGAGDGVVAERLRQAGHDVVAIDSNQTTAAAATADGRPVIHADWLSWDGGGHAPFTALVFTRSLHHIEPLEQAVEQMLKLAPGGLVVADEFGFERVDHAGAQLLVDSRSLLAAAGVVTKEPVAVGDPVAAWQDRMRTQHRVTPASRLLETMGQAAEIEQLGYGRFIARFVAQGIDPTHPNAAQVRDLLIAIEDARIATGSLTPAGIRFVARL